VLRNSNRIVIGLFSLGHARHPATRLAQTKPALLGLVADTGKMTGPHLDPRAGKETTLGCGTQPGETARCVPGAIYSGKSIRIRFGTDFLIGSGDSGG
jgi:hypothetical protein